MVGRGHRWTDKIADQFRRQGNPEAFDRFGRRAATAQLKELRLRLVAASRFLFSVSGTCSDDDRASDHAPGGLDGGRDGRDALGGLDGGTMASMTAELIARL